MRAALLKPLIFASLLSLAGAASADQEVRCPTLDAMKRGVVLLNNEGPAGVFIRLGDDMHTAELFLDENLVVRRDEIYTHDRGLFLSYERRSGVNWRYVPNKPIAELFPLKTGKRWDASMTVFEGKRMVREDVPISYEVGLHSELHIGGCDYAVTELTRMTEDRTGMPVYTKFYYSSELNAILRGARGSSAAPEKVVMEFDELREVPRRM